MPLTLRSLHKYISLGLALFWALQALTGMLLVFQYELDDAGFDRPRAPLDMAAFGRAVAVAEAADPGRRLSSIYTAGVDHRFDVHFTRSKGGTETLRMDGDGTILRRQPANPGLLDTPIFTAALDWHQSLFAGGTGKILVGISGIFLLSNIILGLKLAWPRRRQWRQAFAPQKARGAIASRYAWHRALGLGLAIPALAILSSGVLMVWEDNIGDYIGAGRTTPAPAVTAAAATDGDMLPLADAMTLAMARYPDARFSVIYPPKDNAPWYRFRLLQDGESRRLFGTTTLYLSAHDGRILADYDALSAPVSDRVIKTFYSIHAGDILGAFGRVLVFLTGFWLLIMTGLGVLLWQARRPRKKA